MLWYIRQQSIVCAIKAHLAGSMVSSSSSLSSPSSSSSSSESGQDIWNLIRERREAKNLYSKAMLDVGRLEQCLDAVKIALSASKEEINVAQMRVDEAHARAASKFL